MAATRAAGFTGEVAVGPASLEAFTEVFDQNEFTTLVKARPVSGWAPGNPVVALVKSLVQKILG